MVVADPGQPGLATQRVVGGMAQERKQGRQRSVALEHLLGDLRLSLRLPPTTRLIEPGRVLIAEGGAVGAVAVPATATADPGVGDLVGLVLERRRVGHVEA